MYDILAYLFENCQQAELAPLEKSEQRLNLLLRLLKRKDVSSLVNACDAGREGELIFRYLVQHARIKKPIERLWLQSMTPQAIREGFSKLRPDRELLPLADAAKSRSEADWLVGINGTRAMTAFNSKKGVATEESKPSTQLSPLLFDLTSLQREANGRFGFPARMTLSLAQALYEKHKVLTYPRTDSRALPEDYVPTVKDTLKALGGTDAFATYAGQVLKQGWVKPNKRIFDNTKISDHFAIIPTLQTPKHLNEAEQKLYDMVVRRFLAVFSPAAGYLQTTRIP